MKYITITILAMCCTFGFALGQDNQLKDEGFFKNHMDYELQAFFSIGGSSPLGFPGSIRKIEKYNPSLQLGLEGNATKWFTPEEKWGLRVGISVEGKGMKTQASVKNYFTEIIQDGQSVKGYFTGKVKTNVKNVYLTLPVSAVYSIDDRWNIYGGLFISYLLDEQFDGYVTDGYFRQGKPTAPKINFQNGNKAAYDFSEDERAFQWGAQVGAEYILGNHLAVLGNVSFGINDIFKKDFDALTFGMHNIYLDLGFSYKF